MITAERLRGLFDYNPETGVLTRCISVPNARAGSIAAYRQTSGYIQISVDRRPCLAQHIAWCMMTGEWPKAEIDHINLDRADNRWCNLREASHSQNQANSGIPANNSSGFKGVRWHTRDKKWYARIGINGKDHYLGCYDTPERAFIAYMFAAWRHFGDFAKIDADYLVPLRRLKAERKALERSVF